MAKVTRSLRTVLALGIGGEGAGDVLVTIAGDAILLQYEFFESDAESVGSVRFVDFAASRFHDEYRAFDTWNVENLRRDVIYEDQDSSWMRQLRANVGQEATKLDGYRHFLVNISNFGLLEVIGKKVEPLTTRSGELESRSDHA